MLVPFFFALKEAGVPVSLTEFLALLEGLRRRVAGFGVDDFYALARTALVKDERYFDRFDRAFGRFYEGLEASFTQIAGEIPEEWLRREAERLLSEEEMRQVEALGGWDELMDTLRKRLREQQGRHQGGSKWIGTAGTSPFGAYGYNPEGVRIGQDGNRNFSAVKVWDKREFKNL
ncbi:MAG: VWA domain-containing protein, partial [Gammaproteobacteria bacterium]